MRHPEGGYVLQTPRGMERGTDHYGRDYLIIHFEDDAEPVCILLVNAGAPNGAWVKGEEWLQELSESLEGGKWGDCSDPEGSE